MSGPDRRAGYWNRERETMSAGAREGYQTRWLSRLLALAWDRAPGVRRRLEQAKLTELESRLDLLEREIESEIERQRAEERSQEGRKQPL